jgi:hypothetical protein
MDEADPYELDYAPVCFSISRAALYEPLPTSFLCSITCQSRRVYLLALTHVYVPSFPSRRRSFHQTLPLLFSKVIGLQTLLTLGL